MALDKLFRENLKKNRREGYLGNVRLTPPLTHAVWAGAALFITITLCAWLFWGTYSRRERVMGHLVAQSGTSLVLSRGYGDVSSLLVRTGEVVQKGEPLVRYSADQYLDRGGGTSAKSIAYIQQKIDFINFQIDKSSVDLANTTRSLEEQITYTRIQLKASKSEHAVYEEDAKNLNALADSLATIVNIGYISKVQFQQYKSNAASATIAALRKKGEISQLERQISEMEGERARIISAAEKEGASMRSQLIELKVQILAKSAEAGGLILSPRDGVVARIDVVEGQSLVPGSHVLSLMENDAELQAELIVPSSSIGFLNRGAKLFVRYASYPSNKYGVHGATVREISRASVSEKEAAELLGVSAVKEGGYVVTARLDTQNPITGKKLMPGMILEADLLQEKRHLYEWLIEPVSSLRDASRESESHQ